MAAVDGRGGLHEHPECDERRRSLRRLPKLGIILRAVVSFTDLLGSAEQIIGAPTPVIGAVVNGNANANTLTGTAGSDLITGLAGADIINGAGGNDDLSGWGRCGHHQRWRRE